MKRSAHVHPVLPILAAGLVGAVLPLGVGSAAHAVGGGVGDATFSGYSNSGYAAVVRLEMYEPTIPIPADPQAELNLSYSAVKADTGNSKGRSSYLWPGDAVGEGAKTILENIGVPLPESITAAGYPVQVNSTFPSGTRSQFNEPLPGSVQRTAAGEKTTYAQTGYSSDGNLENGTDADPNAESDDAPDPSDNPAGALTELLSGGLTTVPGQLLGAGGPGGPGSSGPGGPDGSEEPAPPGSAPLLPAMVAAIVDFGAASSIARSTEGASSVRMHTRSKASDINLLGGIIHLSSVSVDATTIGDGAGVVPTTKVTYGELSIAGQGFTVGPEGIEASGQATPIPGLNDDPASALKQLGVTITVPQPENEVDGLLGTAARQGLRVEIDTRVFRSKLDGLPLADIVDGVPDEAGQLKSVLSAAVGAAPRMVVLIGNARSQTETVKPLNLDLGTTPADAGTDPTDAPAGPTDTTTDAGGTAATGGGSGASPAPGTTSGVPTAGGTTPVLDAAQLENTAAASGLPPLASIPGALLFGGLALAALAGSYLRRLGLLALGGGTSCAHGLDSGLPDLRKA